MPRVVELTMPASATDDVLRRLADQDEVLSLRVLRGVSVQPEGDVVVAQVLDTGMASIMRMADDMGIGTNPSLSLSTSLPQSLISAGAGERVERDRSTGTWEEIELTIGRESTMTPPKLLVMVFAGVFATVGLHTGALHVVVGAMLVAPAFEPLARVALGLVNRSGRTRGGLRDFALAYGAIALGAAIAGVLTVLFGTPLSPSADTYLSSAAFVEYWTTVQWTSVVVGACGGVGGALLLVLNRRVLTTGILIALALIPSWSLMVLELIAGDPALAARALLRWAVDVVLVVAGCAAVFAVKRRTGGRQVAAR